MAQFIEWSDALSVGIEEIDAQHEVLTAMVNEMHDALCKHRGGDAVCAVLNKLAGYARIHFAVEESLMRILGYPGYEKHKEEHEGMIAKLQELQYKIETGKTAMGFELMHFLKTWLTRHIVESDQQYAEYFIQTGVKPRLKKRRWASRIWDHLHT